MVYMLEALTLSRASCSSTGSLPRNIPMPLFASSQGLQRVAIPFPLDLFATGGGLYRNLAAI